MAHNEKDRLNAVHEFLQLDFNKSSEFQDIVDLAAQLCNMPVSIITLLDEDVNWLKAKTGVDVEAMPRETSFCQFGIQQDAVLIIPDATKDTRFDTNALVHAAPNVRFYAGAPLRLSNGLKLGTLCLFDIKPNNLTPLQQKTLTILSRQATFLMELELSHKLLQQKIEEVEAKNLSLSKIAQMQSHELRQPLTMVMGLVNSVKEGYLEADAAWIEMVQDATNDLDIVIHSVVSETTVAKRLVN